MIILKSVKSFNGLSIKLGLSPDWLKRKLFDEFITNQYREFEIDKKSGGSRIISAPMDELKNIQSRLAEVLIAAYIPKAPVHGFTKNKNIVTNAMMHCNKKYVFNLDIENFFPTITQQRIRGILMSKPYELCNQVASTIAYICCFQGILPQGSPTSPIISNMVFSKLDSQLRKEAKKNRCIYTRYADDITISTDRDIFPEVFANITGNSTKDVKVGEWLESVISDFGFSINYKKVRIQRKLSNVQQHQEVTGLTVDKKVNIKRKYIREIRAILHHWKNKGYKDARNKYFEKRLDFLNKSFLGYYNRRNCYFSLEIFKFDHINFSNIVRGKIEFISQVRGKEDKIYLRFLQIWNELRNRDTEEIFSPYQSKKTKNKSTEIVI